MAIQLRAYHQSVFHANDVATQNGWLDLWDSDGLSLPGIAHAGDDVVTTHRGQLLAENLGAAIGLVHVFGYDGGFGHHDARACVLELGIDVDVFSLTEAAAIDFSIERHLAIGDEHAGDFLLLHTTCGRL